MPLWNSLIKNHHHDSKIWNLFRDRIINLSFKQVVPPDRIINMLWTTLTAFKLHTRKIYYYIYTRYLSRCNKYTTSSLPYHRVVLLIQRWFDWHTHHTTGKTQRGNLQTKKIYMYCQISNIRGTISNVLSCSCLCRIHWRQVLSREWRCSWSIACWHCSNYIWVIDNFIAC